MSRGSVRQLSPEWEGTCGICRPTSALHSRELKIGRRQRRKACGPCFALRRIVLGQIAAERKHGKTIAEQMMDAQGEQVMVRPERDDLWTKQRQACEHFFGFIEAVEPLRPEPLGAIAEPALYRLHDGFVNVLHVRAAGPFDRCSEHCVPMHDRLERGDQAVAVQRTTQVEQTEKVVPASAFRKGPQPPDHLLLLKRQWAELAGSARSCHDVPLVL